MEFPKPLASVDMLLRVDAKIPQISIVCLIEEVSNKFAQRIFIIMLAVVAVARIIFDENSGSSTDGRKPHERRSCQRGAGHLDCDPIPLDRQRHDSTSLYCRPVSFTIWLCGRGVPSESNASTILVVLVLRAVNLSSWNG